MTKHRGGRGRRAKNKHATISISLPPNLKEALDAAVTAETSRSEVVAELIAAHLVGNTAVNKGPRTTPVPSRPKPTDTMPAAVTVMAQRMPRGLGWKPEKYRTAETLLAEGFTIVRAEGSADYVTEKGNVMSWRTVAALLKLGTLVALTV